jgi:hypothetical protein
MMEPGSIPVAAVITEWRHNSHADVFLSRLLEPEAWRHKTPFALKLASVYADQFPAEGDLCRDGCHRHSVPIFPTIRGAIGLGTQRVAVRGVLVIGEHGSYPINSRGQWLYPRRRLFEGVVDAFRALGDRVPVFSDKHLSYEWLFARWMYDVARHEGIPLMAGSSLPVTWRRPELSLPIGSDLEEAIGLGYADLDAYGFHALETLQCMVERRRGGESGVAAVRCLTGTAVWELFQSASSTRELLEALLRIHRGSAITFQAQDLTSADALYQIEYRDGLKATVGMLNGFGEIFGFAARRRSAPGRSTLDAAVFALQDEKEFGHFGYLLRAIERMMATGRPSYPVERTLLTTGVLSALLQSRAEGGRRIPTPHLAELRYRPVDYPFARGPVGTPA